MGLLTKGKSEKLDFPISNRALLDFCIPGLQCSLQSRRPSGKDEAQKKNTQGDIFIPSDTNSLLRVTHII
jgi:hypothetical protein